MRSALAHSTRPDARAWRAVLKREIDRSAVDGKELADDCRAACAVDPQNPYLEYFLGDSESQLGELDLAIAAFSHAATVDLHWDLPAIRLVECYITKDQPEQAMNAASFLATHHPNDLGAAIVLAQAWAAGIESGQAGQADKLLHLLSAVQMELPSEKRTLP